MDGLYSLQAYAMCSVFQHQILNPQGVGQCIDNESEMLNLGHFSKMLQYQLDCDEDDESNQRLTLLCSEEQDEEDSAKIVLLIAIKILLGILFVTFIIWRVRERQQMVHEERAARINAHLAQRLRQGMVDFQNSEIISFYMNQLTDSKYSELSDEDKESLKDNNLCCICLEELGVLDQSGNEKMISKAPQCSHLFHK